MNRIDGVASVDVSLNEGTVLLKLKPANRVTVDQIREVIRNNGFTPKATQVEAAGRLIERNGKPALDVTVLHLVLLLDDPDRKLEPITTKDVVITGKLPASDAASGNEPRTLLVQEARAFRSPT
jgi:copper chaperone CopZ